MTSRARTLDDDLEDYVWGRVKQLDYLQRVVKSSSTEIDSILRRVSQIDDSLNRQLRKGVEENLSRLLEQTTALEALDRTQRGVHLEMNEVHSSCDRLAKEMQSLLNSYKEEYNKLERLTKAKNMMRDAIRIEELMEQFEKRSELVKRSEIVSEIRGIIEDCPELLQITWLKDTVTIQIKAAENEVRHAAAEDLRRALSSLNASMVAAATKALMNLGVLETELEVQLAASASEVDSKLMELGVAPEWNKQLPVTINLIHTHLEQCTLLGPAHVTKFTDKLARSIRTRVPLDAPFTLRFVQQMGRILQSRPECSLGPLDDALRPLKSSLLSHSLKRLHSLIEQHDFSAAHAHAFVDLLNGVIGEELAKVDWDPDLQHEMQKNIKKCLEMVTKRFELETKLEEENLLLGDRLTSAQTINYRLLQCAHALAGHWPAHSAPLVAFVNDVLSAVIGAVKGGISTILVTLHKEQLGSKEISPYMQELCAYLTRVLIHCNHMGSVAQQSVAIHSMADFVVEQFILHATLLRPINDIIRNQLTNDYERLLTVVSELGFGGRFADPNALVELFSVPIAELCKTSCPVWAIIHVLIADSSSVLASPHDSVEWQIEEYISWCIDHSDLERLAFLNTLVSSYASSVLAKSETQYVPHYPAIAGLLKANLQASTD